VARDGGMGLQVMRVGFNPFIDPATLPDSANAALEVFRRRLVKGYPEKGEIESEGGHFFGKTTPGKFLALIPGTERLCTDKPAPTIYAVYTTDAFAEELENEPFEWYIQALEIVAETCDYVLGEPDPENYYLHWSA